MTHSYKEAKYKCEDCELVGQHPVTMEVHMGKFHSKKFEFCLCNFEAGNWEKLDTHLFT